MESMELRTDGGKTGEHNSHGSLSPALSSQPWWRGPSFGDVCLSRGDTRTLQLDSSDGKGDLAQDIRNGKSAEDLKQMQHISPLFHPMMPEYCVPQVGQSVGCAAFAFSDSYGSMMSTCAPQIPMHPQIFGMPQARMLLPPEMAEEPVYVNAKQYHGILRRRQSRAKAELEKKIIKSRKPYLHESRHLHAMRRARGCGGRFLNTKKTDGDTSNSNRGTEFNMASASSGDPDFLYAMPEENMLSFEGVLRPHKHNGDMDGCWRQSGFQFSPFRSKKGDRMDEGDCSGQRRGALMVNQPRKRALAI